MRALGFNDTLDKKTAYLVIQAQATTTSTSPVPIYGFGLPFRGRNKKYRITYSIIAFNSTSDYSKYYLYVDGVQVSATKSMYGGNPVVVSDSVDVFLSEGIHWIQPYFNSKAANTAYANTGTYADGQSTITVEEL